MMTLSIIGLVSIQWIGFRRPPKPVKQLLNYKNEPATQWEPRGYGPAGGRECISCSSSLPVSGCLELYAKARL